MITTIEGSIGGGKSYFAVNDILKNFFTWDDDNIRWVKRSDIPDFEIVSNVDGFYLAKDLDEEIRIAGGKNIFFTKEYQFRFTREKKFIYVIDEVHEYFDRKFYNTDVFNMFKYHRHVGFDCYFMTQELTDVARELQNVHEYHFHTIRRSFSLTGGKGGFRYQLMSGSKPVKNVILPIDYRVFLVYKSSSIVYENRPKSVMFRFYYYILIFAIVGITMFGWLIHGFTKRSKVSRGVNSSVADVRRTVETKKKYRVAAICGKSVFLVGSGASTLKRSLDSFKELPVIGSMIEE